MKDVKIQIPDNCDIHTIHIEKDAKYAVIIFKELKPQLPKSWEEFCEMFPIQKGKEFYFNTSSKILNSVQYDCVRNDDKDKNMLPDRATAEAVLALCQLIQLRNCYNGDWVPDWKDNESKFAIDFIEAEIYAGEVRGCCTPLFFKTKELRDEFLRCFRPLIEKLKPLYGIKEGGKK